MTSGHSDLSLSHCSNTKKAIPYQIKRETNENGRAIIRINERTHFTIQLTSHSTTFGGKHTVTWDRIVLDAIPFSTDFESLVRQVRVRRASRYFDDLESLWREAQAIARPKTLYQPAFIETIGEDHVIVDGTPLKSRVLKVNLNNTHRAFPFVATCGTELDNWSKSLKGILHSFSADIIKQMALTTALHYLDSHVKDHFNIGKISL
jgi:hypothetical protein